MAIGGGTNFSFTKSTTVKVVLTDDSGNALFAYGSTAPSSAAGYAVGCIWLTTSGSIALSINVGSATSCNFSTTLSGT